jgi:hypothetical protein
MSDREEFEEWAANEKGIRNFTLHDDGEYLSERLADMWQAWQAVSAQSRQEVAMACAYCGGAEKVPAQQVSVPESIIEVVTDMLEDYARALDLGDLDDAGHSTTSCIYEVIDELAATPQPEGDAVAVPVAALEYLKDQWPGAYAKLYERICSNNLPQPQKEDA